MNVPNNVFPKHPEAILDFEWDWDEWLEIDESIVTATITMPTGLTLDSHTDLSRKIIGWFSGGTVRAKYRVDCHIITNNVPAREDTRSIFVHCTTR